MKNRYQDLIEQTFDFPQEEFNVIDNELHFNQVPIMEVIKQYGTPLKITYLPKISSQIQKAKKLFNVAFAKTDYKGKYTYCYCTKSSHFSFVIEEALKNDIHLETSSAYDLEIVKALAQKSAIDKNGYIICNGFKRTAYTTNICELINDGFKNVIPVLDNMQEIEVYKKGVNGKCQLGIRIASEEEPNFPFYTSRLGIRYKAIVDFYKNEIQNSEQFELKMLHFFINTGIDDTQYYWNELLKCVNLYCELKKNCPELDSLNIGGGFPIKNYLGFEYDYEHMIELIVSQIKETCAKNNVPEPNIFTEFGTFTVGESGATFYSVLDVKQQNDKELWYMIDSSFMTTIPDTWTLGKRFVMLPINHWDQQYRRVNLGGLTCDSMDFYDSEAHQNQVFLPTFNKDDQLYIGFFNTGAYQESVGGFGGIQHCLLPAPKHVIIDRTEKGEYTTKLFSKEQSAKSMLKILGY
jgi:arginine decarboxylase